MSQNLEQVYNLTQLQPKLCEEILHNLERSVGLTKDDSAKFAPVSPPRSVGRSPIFVVNKASKCISGGGNSPYSRHILTFSGAHTLCSAIQKSANCLESITCEALCEESVFFIAESDDIDSAAARSRRRVR
jgi:hypothetical protein